MTTPHRLVRALIVPEICSHPYPVRLGAITLIVGVGMLVYRAELQWAAHWITKTLCEDRAVFNGAYGRCIEHYRPATS